MPRFPLTLVSPLSRNPTFAALAQPWTSHIDEVTDSRLMSASTYHALTLALSLPALYMTIHAAV
jgi:hypothetical protein